MEIKVRLSEIYIRLIEQVSNITNTKYEIDQNDYIEEETLLNALDELKSMYDYSVEKLQDFTNEVDEYYVKKKGEYEYGE